jgi:acyl-CoA thioesterase
MTATRSALFDLQSTHDPHRWILPVTESLCVGPLGGAFLFGGVGLGAAIAAMEGMCGRPVIWATAQYLTYARPPSIIELDVRVVVQGRHTTQARVSAHVGDREIFTANAALGERPVGEGPRQWVAGPAAPPPDACEETRRWVPGRGDLHDQLEVRVASGRHGAGLATGEVNMDGRLLLWIRARGAMPVNRSMLAIMADHVPSGVGPALGRRAGGNSLDNTIRFVSMAPTEWVLCEIAIEGVAGGFGHGAMRMFSQRGALLAIASQSMIIRIRDGSTSPDASARAANLKAPFPTDSQTLRRAERGA